MQLLFSPDDLCVMDLARQALDPGRRMNPGKMIPTHRCGEVRTQPLSLPDGALA